MTDYSKTLVFENDNSGESHYCRSSSTERSVLENSLLRYYDVPNTWLCRIFPSGMSAISTIFTVFSQQSNSSNASTTNSNASTTNSNASTTSSSGNRVFILGNELYCDTEKVCKYLMVSNPNLRYETVDVRNETKIFDLFKKYGDQIKVFFIESCTNPSGQVFNFALIPALRVLAPNCLFIVDNTWLTAYSFNPFKLSADNDGNVDIVIESMTKYISGGTCIGGMVIGNPNVMTNIVTHAKINGLFIGRDHCQMFLNALSTLSERISNVSLLSSEAAKYIESLIPSTPEKTVFVDRVMHPMLPTHPTTTLAKKYLKYAPGIIWFHVAMDKKLAQVIIKKKNLRPKILGNDYLPFETSYGSSYSKLDQYPIQGSACMYDYDDLKNTTHGLWLRISIGYQSNMQTIVDGINQIIKKLQDKQDAMVFDTKYT